MSTTIIIMIDGLDPEYLEVCPAPRLEALARTGYRLNVRGMMPSVTNVNNVSLVTGSYPESHGITSNYWLDKVEGGERYMESAEYIKSETMFERAASLGIRSLLVTAKDKLRRLLSNGTTLSVSSEQPPDWVVNGVGTPPDIYSLEVNRWVLDAGRYILSEQDFDLVYLTTTDYAMHSHAPDEPESARHIALLDKSIGKLVDAFPDARFLITADHGMSSKTRMLHLPDYLARAGIKARAIPIIKDQYTVHHSNLGGCIYVHLEGTDNPEPALEVLRNIDGVEEALSRQDAASRFKLMPERIGDIMALGAHDVVFGDPAEVEFPQKLRSHGSTHELDIPVIAFGDDLDVSHFTENRSLGQYVIDHVLKR
jgi:phosphonoacetate hydrolase